MLVFSLVINNAILFSVLWNPIISPMNRNQANEAKKIIGLIWVYFVLLDFHFGNVFENAPETIYWLIWPQKAVQAIL